MGWIVIIMSYGQTQKVTQQLNKPSVDSLKKLDRPMTDEERKYVEYMEWQQKTNRVLRSEQNDKNLETIDKQATTLDSLIIQQPIKKSSDLKKK